ncbi:PH domain-containing protein [Halosolutus gelatinilyticus]|uniref:PH domain-containing protein n=1 Tax=Halosolutus gelatinilyticus TaxID=2931975 RepID=UPI001FF3096A|nr:PH domain-containing protein [Halosolutus gelatinilyticus]
MTAPDLDPADLEWLSLDADEEVVWASGPDRRTLIPALLVGIPLSIVLIGIFVIVGEYFRVTNTHYVVTDQALYKKTGVFSRDVKRIEHGKIQDISYSQSALGNHFGYGDVDVSTAGGSGVELSFDSVPDPRAVQQRISELIDRPRREGDDERSTDDALAEILTELRAIRAAVEESKSDAARPSKDGRGARDGDDRRRQR